MIGHENEQKHGLRLRLRDYVAFAESQLTPTTLPDIFFVEKAFAAKSAFFSFIKKGFLRSVLKCNFYCREINLMILKGPAVDVLPRRGTKIISLIILSRNPPLLINVPF